MSLSDLSSHFRFGENWKSFIGLINEAEIADAMHGLQKLIPDSDIRGKRFLDIGCGSGLSMLAALRLGADDVVGIDIDPDSVDAARSLFSKFSKFASGQSWDARLCSVFEMDPAALGAFDVVYSWGVLHHTGDLWRAFAKAASFVRPGGLFVVALYHRTPLCGFWRIEKRFYSQAPNWQQRIVRGVYKAAFLLRVVARGHSPGRFIEEYKRRRGMDWNHDVHDWLGGYPYESTLPLELAKHLEECGLVPEQVFENRGGTQGFLGTGCDEYVARRPTWRDLNAS